VLVAYNRVPPPGNTPFALEVVAVSTPKYNQWAAQKRINGYGRVFLA